MPFDTVLALSTHQLLQDLGYLGVALLMFAETLFPPIPSEAILPLAGYLVEQGELTFAGVLVASTAGALLGSMVLYEMARRGGRPFAHRFLRVARIDPAKLDDAERWFARRGPIVVVAARCVPGVRSLIALPAGVLRMSRGVYLAASLVGTLLWNVLLIGAGWLLGAQWEQASDTIGALSKPALGLAGLLAVAAAFWAWRSSRRPSSAR